MKIIVNFEKLKAAVDRAFVSSSKNNQNPILKGIYFEASSTSLLIRSTNVNMGYQTELLVNVEEEGKFLISGEILTRILSSLSSTSAETCSLVYSEGVCELTYGKHYLKIKTITFEAFPELPEPQGVDIVCKTSVITQGIKNSIFAVAKTEIKPELSGVYIYTDGENECIYFVATDSYRLIERKLKTEDVLPEMTMIVPEKNAKDILRLLDEAGSDCTLTLSKNSLKISIKNETIVTRLIEGVFPKYKQIIPTAPTSFAVFLKEDLLKCLKITSFFSDKTEQVQFAFKEDVCEVEASNFEVGSITETFKNNLKGEEFSVKINSKYLEEFISQIKDDSLVLKFTAQNKALIIEGIQDSNMMYLLMPSYR